jgi:transcriptional regulator with XRE-family HTH domain
MEDEKFLLKLGQKIEKLSIEKFRTQTEFSDVSGIDTRTIRRIIKAEQNPTIMMLRKISRALEINLHDLVNLE